MPIRSASRTDSSRSGLGLVAAPLAAVATAATIAATATAITAAAAAISASAAAAATAGRSRLARPGLIHGQRATFDGLAIDFGDRVLRVLLRSHRHKSEAARLAGEFVLHEGDFLHSTGLRKKLLQFIFRRVEGKIAYV